MVRRSPYFITQPALRLVLTAALSYACVPLLAGNTSWTLNLDNVHSTFTGSESVNSVTISGTLAYPSTGFTQFTVTAASGGVAPALNTVFYGIQVPGVALVVEPIETNEKEMIYSVTSGVCPSSNFSSAFLFNQEDPAGSNDFTKNSQPAFGTMSWTNSTITAVINNLYNVSAGATVSGFSSLSIVGTSCSSGVTTAPGQGDRGGTFYLNSQGTAMFRTNASKGVFIVPSSNILDVHELQGSYAVLAAVNGITGTTTGYNVGYSPTYGGSPTTPGYSTTINGAVEMAAYRITIDATGEASSGNLVDPGTGSTGSSASIAISSVNSPVQGFVRGTFTSAGQTGSMNCSVYLSSQISLFCIAQNPASPTNAINLVMVADPIVFTRTNSGLDNDVLTVATAIDSANAGKIYVGGDFVTYSGTTVGRIARLGTDGSLDTGFNTGTGFDNTVWYIYPATDSANLGKVYVGGSFAKYNGGAYARIVRLNADGSVDGGISFGSGFDNDVYTITTANATNPSKVYVGGLFTHYQGTTAGSIVRLNTDGSLDTTFAVGTGFDDDVITITPYPDYSNLYVGGNFLNFNGTAKKRIVRLVSTGALDATFVGGNVNGEVYTILPALDSANAGKLYTSGFFTKFNSIGENYIARITSVGGVDVTFNTGGTSGLDNDVTQVVLPTDSANLGKIYVAGGFQNYGSTAISSVARLTSTGAIDSTFVQGDGIEGDVSNTYLQDAILATDSANAGKIYVTGFLAGYNNEPNNSIVRINTNGSMDTTFSQGSPSVRTGFNGGVILFQGATDLANSGKIYIGGQFSAFNRSFEGNFARITPGGFPDWGYNVGGTGFNGSIAAVGPAIDSANVGKVYVGGNFSTYNGTTRNNLARLNSDGTLDTSFSIGTGFDQGVVYVVSDVAGHVYVGGDFLNFNGVSAKQILRLNSDGSYDSTFVIGSGTDDEVGALLLPTDTANAGKIYIGGNFTKYKGTAQAAISRLNSNGSIDTSFAIGTGFNATGDVYFMVPVPNDPGGRIYAGGTFTAYNGTAAQGVVRLNSNGTVDATFTGAVSGGLGEVDGVAVATDTANLGKVYVVGDFQKYGGVAAHHIARANTDGSLDSTFSTGAGFNAEALMVLPVGGGASDVGDIYVGGFFTTFNGSATGFFLRLNSTGSTD